MDREAIRVGGDARLRAAPEADPGGGGDRSGAGGDGRLRRSRLALLRRPLGGGGGSGRGGGGAMSAGRRPNGRAIRRAALVHDLGRVAVPARVWQTAGSAVGGRVGAGEAAPISHRAGSLALAHSWPRSLRSPALTTSGWTAPAITAARRRDPQPAARLLAVADAYHAMTEPRPHRAALAPERAAEVLGRGGPARGDSTPTPSPRCSRRRGKPVPEDRAPVRAHRAGGRGDRPARARAADQASRPHARASPSRPPTTTSRTPTAKIGVSTRAAAAVFAMERGLVPPQDSA